MNDDLLQDRLSRLETGEPLQNVLADLSADEAELVRTAAALRALPHPARALDAVSAQRAQLLAKAQRGKTMTSSNSSRRWLWGGLALAGAAAFLFLCAFAVLGGAVWLWNSSPNVAQGPVINPIISAAAAPNPQTAVLSEARGRVEVQASDGAWRAVHAGATLTAGQRLRTGALSGAALSFYDGSRATLGPDTEIALTALDAQRTGKRVVQLTQVNGESDHAVAKSTHSESAYEVATPSGTGRARGTEFHVSVLINLIVRFSVTEGAVAVSNLNVTVIVNAGQTTLVTGDEPPAPPVASFSGEGKVESIAETWTIAGQVMLVDPGTLIEGDPQAGDWVSFEGRLLPGGMRVADRISLLHRAVTNTFTFIGTVDVISDTAWTISGRAIVVNAQTLISDTIVVNDQVEVAGRIEADGTFLAVEIRLFTEGSGAPFEFTGVVETLGDDAWVISGLSVTVNVSTTIEAGIVEGDVVHVTGEVLADGTWQAGTIEKVSETGVFDFVGVVISTDPWNVSGVTFETDAETDIDDGIQTGNRVRVRGRVLPNGTWLADAITQLDEGQRHAIQFSARVQSIEPWLIGGVTVTVDSKTKIEGDIEVGDLVTVRGNLLPDGAVIAKKITLIAKGEGSGCTTLIATVTNVTTDTLTLEDGQTITLTTTLSVTGELQVNAVVEIQVCVGEDDQLVIVSITVLYQAEPTPTPEITPTPDPSEGGKVTICHLPGGDPNKAKTITVGANAVASHLAHGDTLGPCPASPGKPNKP